MAHVISRVDFNRFGGRIGTVRLDAPNFGQHGPLKTEQATTSERHTISLAQYTLKNALSATETKYPMSVEMEDIDGGLCIVVESLDERIECG